MPLTIQAKLLRVLQEREFMRIGGTRAIKLNVRFIAATNKDLQKVVREEKFRLDLFYRLNVVSLSMPALRDRPEDIPLLTDHFVARYSARANRKVKGLSPAARVALSNYDWPGNIRELENAIERARCRYIGVDSPGRFARSAFRYRGSCYGRARRLL